MRSAATAFERQMHAVSQGAGRYQVVLDPMWNCPVSTHGGTATAVLVSAMQTELDSTTQQLRTVSAMFEVPVGPGPVDIEVRVTRRGRSVSYVVASMRDVGASAGITAIASFGTRRPGFEFTDSVMPSVPPPGEPRAITAPDPAASNRYWQPGCCDARRVLGSTSNEDWQPTSTNARWLRFDEPPMCVDGSLNPLALVAFGDVMPGAVYERMGWDPQRPHSIVVNADYSLHLIEPARSEWVLSVNRAHRVSDGYASVESSLWDEHGSLDAFATGVLVQLFPDGPPPTDKLTPLA